MGKGIYYYLTADILTKVLQKYSSYKHLDFVEISQY